MSLDSYPLKELLDWLNCQGFVAAWDHENIIHNDDPYTVCSFWDDGTSQDVVVRVTASEWDGFGAFPAIRLSAVPADPALLVRIGLISRRCNTIITITIDGLVPLAEYHFLAEVV